MSNSDPTERAAFLLSLADRLTLAEVTQPEGDRVRVPFTREELRLAIECVDALAPGEAAGLARAIVLRVLRQWDAEDN